MLYVTTRDNHDAFTAHRALHENRGADGGMYVPFKHPCFTQGELDALLKKPFSQCTADVLNLLFHTKLTGADLDFAIGRRPLRLQNMGHRIIVAEAWHNPDWNFTNLVRNLTRLLRNQETGQPGDWTRIAVRTAVLFGVFAELRQEGLEQAMDISVVAGDFSAPISAWYARKWGLPVGNIVCCCNENNGLWDLFCHGQMRTDTVSVLSGTPDADITVPTGLERLIYECGGVGEVQRYLEICQKGKPYSVDEEMLEKLSGGMYVSVVSGQRMNTTIPSVYRTHGYLLSPYAALAYAGLLDYRAKTGETRKCLIMAEKSPICDAETVAAAMGISAGDVENYI